MDSSKRLMLGIDLGTSAVKTLVLDETGDVVGRGRASYEIHRPKPGFAEQSPAVWWEAVRDAVAQALSTVDRSLVVAIGLSGQLNGLVFVDNSGGVLCDAPIWLDQRASAESSELAGTVSDLTSTEAFGIPNSVHGLSKLVWYLRRRPEVIDKTHRVLFPKDYINFRLTHRAGSDPSDAGAALMLNMRTRKWSSSVLKAAGIPESILPELGESPDLLGTLTGDAASQLGLRDDVVVVHGAGDMAALAVGTGVISPKTACATIGTAGHVAIYQEDVPEKPVENIWLMCHAVPGKYFWHGLVMTGGYCLSWFREKFGRAEIAAAQLAGLDPYDLLVESARHSPPGSNGLIFLPFLNGAATPYNNPGFRACFIGARASHNKADFIRSVLEGVAYNFRDSFEILRSTGIEAGEVRTGEGGSRSRLWREIIADTLGSPVIGLKEMDSSALGAAVIAGVGGGVWKDFEEACRVAVKTQERLEYSKERHDLYSSRYVSYRKICEALGPVFDEFDPELG